MEIMRTRRSFLTAMSAAGALGLFKVPRLLAAEGPLETTSVRLLKSSLICSAAPQFAAEGLLRAEGFKELTYVEVPRTELPQAFSDGRVDFTVTFAGNHIQAIDRGTPITIWDLGPFQTDYTPAYAYLTSLFDRLGYPTRIRNLGNSITAGGQLGAFSQAASTVLV